MGWVGMAWQKVRRVTCAGCPVARTRQGEWLGSSANVASVSLRSAGRLEAGKVGQLQRGCGVNAEVRIRNVERLSGALQRAARTGSAQQIRNAVALNWRGIVEVAFVEERELSFHFVG